MNSNILAIDIGTSACKAAVFSNDIELIAAESEEYKTDYPSPNTALQNPDDWWAAVCKAVKSLLEKVDASSIECIGVDGQSWSAVAVDSQGRVLCPTPIWTDTAASAECEELRSLIPDTKWFETGRNPLQPGYTLPKILRYKNTAPQVYENAAYILQSNSFIVYRLTGEATQDISQGYGLQCFDMKTGKWNKEMLTQVGIRPALLPEIRACHDIVGRVTKEAAAFTGLKEGTPVIAGGLDAACACLGVGVTQPGQTQEQGGQAGGMSICTDNCTGDSRLIMSYHVIPGKWLLQGGTTGGGGALRWIRGIIGGDLSFRQMDELAETVGPGSDGLIFLPYLAGERSPLWNPDAKGVFYGLNYLHTKAHIIRAVMEGTAFALRHNLETASNAGSQTNVLRAMGGSATSRIWTQIKSDVTGKKIEVPSASDATVRGTALIAALGAGIMNENDIVYGSIPESRRTHNPSHEAEKIYEYQYGRYLELYERLEPMMKG